MVRDFEDRTRSAVRCRFKPEALVLPVELSQARSYVAKTEPVLLRGGDPGPVVEHRDDEGTLSSTAPNFNTSHPSDLTCAVLDGVLDHGL